MTGVKIRQRELACFWHTSWAKHDLQNGVGKNYEDLKNNLNVFFPKSYVGFPFSVPSLTSTGPAVDSSDSWVKDG